MSCPAVTRLLICSSRRNRNRRKSNAHAVLVVAVRWKPKTNRPLPPCRETTSIYLRRNYQFLPIRVGHQFRRGRKKKYIIYTYIQPTHIPVFRQPIGCGGVWGVDRVHEGMVFKSVRRLSGVRAEGRAKATEIGGRPRRRNGGRTRCRRSERGGQKTSKYINEQCLGE